MAEFHVETGDMCTIEQQLPIVMNWGKSRSRRAIVSYELGPESPVKTLMALKGRIARASVGVDVLRDQLKVYRGQYRNSGIPFY